MLYQKPLFKEFLFATIILAILNYIGHYFNLFWKLDEFDSLLHFIAGATFALCTIWIYFFSGYFEPQKRGLLNYFIISLLGVVFVSVAWEIFELVAGIAVDKWQEYPFDTTLDFVMDFLGGVAACLYAYLKEMPTSLKTSFVKVEPPENLPI